MRRRRRKKKKNGKMKQQKKKEKISYDGNAVDAVEPRGMRTQQTVPGKPPPSSYLPVCVYVCATR